MGTVHGAAKVRPDGKVQMGVTVSENTYRVIRDWCATWHISAGEAIDRLVQQQQEEPMSTDTTPEALLVEWDGGFVTADSLEAAHVAAARCGIPATEYSVKVNEPDGAVLYEGTPGAVRGIHELSDAELRQIADYHGAAADFRAKAAGILRERADEKYAEATLRCPNCGSTGLEYDGDTQTAFCNGCAVQMPVELAYEYEHDPQRYMVCLDGGDPNTAAGVDGEFVGLRQHEAIAYARGLQRQFGRDALVTLVLQTEAD